MSKLYGIQTESALKNFPLAHHQVQKELMYALAEVKLAAVRANAQTGAIDQVRAEAVEAACREILAGSHDDQFVVSDIQGGAGTSINMNVNEVIATRATQMLNENGKSETVHPLDHVNRSQSTNDVNPTALKITLIRLGKSIETELDLLADVCHSRGKEFSGIVKLGRTHLQDAVPMTVGQEFDSWSAILMRHRQRLQEAFSYCRDINLGGTAIGTGANATDEYRIRVIKELQQVTGENIRVTDNLIAQTSSQTDFVHVINVITVLLNDLSKIANDIRVLASGPRGGIGEIVLPEKQKGSTIMPGKVNPVIPETVNQVYFFVCGKRTTVEQAAQAAQLQLGVMFPVLADAILSSCKITRTTLQLFREECIATLTINTDAISRHLEESTAYATLLTPRLGYDVVSDIVKEAISGNRTLREVVIQRNILSETEFNQIVQTDSKE